MGLISKLKLSINYNLKIRITYHHSEVNVLRAKIFIPNFLFFIVLSIYWIFLFGRIFTSK